MAGPPAAAKQINKVVVRLAGRRFLPLWAVLRHSGRKSGKQYAIPVAVIPTETTFIIAMPWGRGTDWVRNVLRPGAVRSAGRVQTTSAPIRGSWTRTSPLRPHAG